MKSGVRCAETTRHSCGTPNYVSISSACRIVSQSDLLPMMTATSGRASVMRRSYVRFPDRFRRGRARREADSHAHDRHDGYADDVVPEE